MDSHGNYTGVTQLSLGQNIQLAPEKTFLFTHNKKFGNLYGDSDLRGAYRSYWAKKFIINFWNVFLERMGSPMTLIKYPQGADQILKDTLKKILTNLGSKTESAQVPGGRGRGTDRSEACSGERRLWHGAAIPQQQHRACDLDGDLVRRGRRNRHNSRLRQPELPLQLRILFKMADQISKQLAAELTCQVIKQLVEFNYGPDAEAPEFVWQDYGQFEGMKIADEIRQLHAAGIIDTWIRTDT